MINGLKHTLIVSIEEFWLIIDFPFAPIGYKFQFGLDIFFNINNIYIEK